MLFQQLKSLRSVKIEADNVYLPIGQFDYLEESTPIESSLNGTPSIAVASYDHYNTSRPNKQSTKN